MEFKLTITRHRVFTSPKATLEFKMGKINKAIKVFKSYLNYYIPEKQLHQYGKIDRVQEIKSDAKFLGF